jgi:Ca2+-binding EF-hand superfamily protein
MCARVREEEGERRREFKASSPKGKKDESLGEVDTMRSAFFAIDADQSGEIDPSELAGAMATMSADRVTTDMAAGLMAEVDFDNSGTLSYDEFVFLMTKWNARGGDRQLHEAFAMVKARVAKVEALRAQFDRVDVDASGEIDAGELSLAMVGAGQKDVGEAEAAELIDLVDKDGTGTLDFEEFVSMMTQIDMAARGGSEAAREERLNHAFDLVKQKRGASV